MTERRSSPASEMPADVSVVVACHSADRLPLLERCIESALAQDMPPREVVVAVDNNESLYRRLAETYSCRLRVRIVANTGPRGASAARNCGVRAARGAFVAFLDDDVVADPAWLRLLIAPLERPQVAGTGGSACPRWQTGRPRWFPDEFLWVVGASYRGMPTTTADVRNVWSENMAIRRDQFLSCGGFREGFGKHGDVSRPEDTEMCIRFARRSGDHWVYVPAARIEHFVPARRSTFRFFLGRCQNEGAGKVEMRTLTQEGLSSERSYATRTVPAAVGRYAWRSMRGDLRAALQLGAVLAGCLAAITGALRALLGGPVAQLVELPQEPGSPQRAVRSRVG